MILMCRGPQKYSPVANYNFGGLHAAESCSGGYYLPADTQNYVLVARLAVFVCRGFQKYSLTKTSHRPDGLQMHCASAIWDYWLYIWACRVHMRFRCSGGFSATMPSRPLHCVAI